MLSEGKTAGAIIELKEAIELTANYRVEVPNGIKAHLIDASLVQQVLDQVGCVGIRIYNGYDKAQGKVCPVIVGVSAADEDMTAGIILDHMVKSPPHLINSVLND
jgi:hypothetical protein